MPEARFCARCGTALAGARPVRPPPPPAAAPFSGWVPPANKWSPPSVGRAAFKRRHIAKRPTFIGWIIIGVAVLALSRSCASAGRSRAVEAPTAKSGGGNVTASQNNLSALDLPNWPTAGTSGESRNLSIGGHRVTVGAVRRTSFSRGADRLDVPVTVTGRQGASYKLAAFLLDDRSRPAEGRPTAAAGRSITLPPGWNGDGPSGGNEVAQTTVQVPLDRGRVRKVQLCLFDRSDAEVARTFVDVP